MALTQQPFKNLNLTWAGSVATIPTTPTIPISQTPQAGVVWATRVQKTPAPTKKQAPIKQTSQQQANETHINNTLADLSIDVKNWHSIEDINWAYPEIPVNILSDMYTDIKNGFKILDIKKAYPELNDIQIPEFNPYWVQKSQTADELMSTSGWVWDTISAGIYNTWKWLAQWFMGGVNAANDLLNRGSNVLSQNNYQLPTNSNQTAGWDIANIASSALNTAAAATLPIATAVLWWVSEVPWVKQVMQFVSDKSKQWIWLITSQIPGYNSLPQEDQDNLNGAIANTIMTIIGSRSHVQEPSKVISNIGWKVSSLTDMTWLSPLEKNTIKTNPYIGEEFSNLVEQWKIGVQEPKKVMQERLQSITDQLVQWIDQKIANLKNTWPLYEKLKQNPREFDLTSAKSKISDILTHESIKVKSDWTLDFSQSNIGSKTDMNKIQQAYDRLNWVPNTINAKLVLNLRQSLDDMANYEEWATNKSNNIIKRIRQSVDNVAKNNVPWLKEADDLFSRQIIDLTEAKKWLINSKTWQPLAGAYSKVKNANTLTNTTFANTLDKYFPWTKERVDAIHSAWKLYDTYTKPAWLSLPAKLSAKLLEWWIWAVVASVFWPAYWIWSFILSHIVEKGFEKISKSMKSSQIEKLIKSISPEQMNKLEEIWTKVQARQKLDDSDKKIIDETMIKINNAIWQEKLKIDTNEIIKSLEKGLPFTPEAPYWQVIPTENYPMKWAENNINDIFWGNIAPSDIQTNQIPSNISENIDNIFWK